MLLFGIVRRPQRPAPQQDPVESLEPTLAKPRTLRLLSGNVMPDRNSNGAVEPRQPSSPAAAVLPQAAAQCTAAEMSKPRRAYRPWSEEEIAALEQGVVKHGEGHWKEIVADVELSFALTGRSTVNVKDKWRNMQRRAAR